MGIEVPDGNTVPEQSEPGKQGIDSAQETFKSKIWLVVIVVLAVATVLISVLPDWGEKDKAESSLITESLNQGGNNDDQPGKSQNTTLFFESKKGPFNVTLPLFSAKVTEGYGTEEDLKQDLNQLAKFVLNDAITTNVEGGMFSSGVQVPTGDVATPEMVEDGGVAQDALASNTAAMDESDNLNLDNIDDYSTNNQEFTIDRADFVKSDGNLVFAAYSDYLVVWTTDGGRIITQIQMPPLNLTGYMGYVDDAIEPMPVDGGTTDGSTGGGSSSSSGGNFASVENPAVATRTSIWWNPKPRIEALLVYNDRLTVVISGYGTEHSQSLDHVPILSDYLATRIQVYDINGGDLQIVSETDVNGSFRNAYAADENVYVVTQSSINTWDNLVALVQRWQPQFTGLNSDEYIQAVTDLADDGLVEDFVDKLVAELQVNGEIDLARLSVFADSISPDNVEESLLIGITGNGVTQVVAFDMTLGSSDNVQALEPHISATFQPGSWGQVYAMGSMIIVADQGWGWIEEDSQAAQKTFLIGFRLDGPISYHALVGSVPGYLLNPFSLDYVEKSTGTYLRIATTQSFWTPWFGISPMEGDVVVMNDQPAEMAVQPESSTLNQIIVLRVVTDSNVFEQVGSLQLGEPNEVSDPRTLLCSNFHEALADISPPTVQTFTSIRFFDDFAYAVTFEQTDPFYVVDLSNEQPVKGGELKVSGFSEYLHPIDSDDKFLVAVGQDTNDSGNILGLQISLFDATDPANPSLIDRLAVEQGTDTSSSSSASWDERAFRFLKLAERTGKIIIPVSIYTWQEFDEVTGQLLETPQDKNYEGFSVFNIENNRITKDFDIDHSLDLQPNATCNNMYDWLPERSFVFSGAVMTMKKYTIVSTNLSTGETLWTVPISDALLGCKI